MKAALQPREISDKFVLRFDTPQSGLFSSIGCDILGPYKYRYGPNTRANKLCKAWLLLICCQFTSGLNAVVMDGYSSKAFITAMETHIAQFRKPCMITCDAGSQFKSVASRARSHDLEQTSEVEDERPDIFSRVQTVFKDIRFFVASSGAQWQNGLREVNFKQVKLVLRKLTGHYSQHNICFKSSFELERLFTKTCGFLNSRPIFYNQDYYVSVKTLMCPGFLGENLEQILSDIDSNFRVFLQLFVDSIIDGSFQKFGGKSLSKAENLKKDDFVMVIFETQKRRCFRIVLDVPTKHSVEVKVLQRKTIGNATEFVHKSEVFSAKQVMLIYREKKR